MSTGLFDSPPRSIVRPQAQPDDADSYRALSGAAIAAAALAALSPLAFFDWWLATVPVTAIVLAGVAILDIARRPVALTGRRLALAAACLAAVMLAGGLTRLARDYAAELPAGFTRASYALLQPAAGDPPGSVPESARALHGANVLLKGYIYPTDKKWGIVEFLLVRDQGDCCFGGNPKITDRVLVHLADPAGIADSRWLTTVAGRFRVEPTGTDTISGGVLYHLDEACVR